MQKRKLVFILSGLIFSFLLSTNAVNALNQKLTNEQSAAIKGECSNIKQSIKRVQNSDRNTRVSLGRTYQQILNDFIMPLNVRLVKNNQFNADLNDIQNDFAQKRDEFNKNYISYGQELETLLSTDCKENPEEFYSNLEKTRAAREKVASSVKKLQEILNQHVTEVEKLQESLRTPVKEGEDE